MEEREVMEINDARFEAPGEPLGDAIEDTNDDPVIDPVIPENELGFAENDPMSDPENDVEKFPEKGTKFECEEVRGGVERESDGVRAERSFKASSTVIVLLFSAMVTEHRFFFQFPSYLSFPVQFTHFTAFEPLSHFCSRFSLLTTFFVPFVPFALLVGLVIGEVDLVMLFVLPMLPM